MISAELQFQIRHVIFNLDREYKVPVSDAFANCDGSYDSFVNELNSQAWEYPELPVEHILSKIV